MTNSKTTKRALFSSVVALLLCFTMLLGTTFAWFTDSAASGSNVITSGNLDIEVTYTLGDKDSDGKYIWKNLDGANDLFQKGLWEPGHTEVVVLRIENKGTLAAKYEAQMNIVNETYGKNKDGNDIILSDILTVETNVVGEDKQNPSNDQTLLEIAFGWEDMEWLSTPVPFKSDRILNVARSNNGVNDAECTMIESGDAHYVVVKVDMDETVGNEANHDGENVPTINFGINVLATQNTKEFDSFGNQYDKDAYYSGALNVNGNVLSLTGDTTLQDEPLMQNLTATEAYTINGNGYTVTGTASSVDAFTWSEDGKIPAMSTIFSSADKTGALVTVNDITFTGTMSSIMAGQYVDSSSNWFNTEFNNVNIVDAKVISFSAGISPALSIYGNMTMNNCEVTGTKLSELDTDPMWPAYDVAVVNYSNTVINNSKIGSLYMWNQAQVAVAEGSEVETIVVRGNMNASKYGLTVEAGATVGVIDLTNITNVERVNITIEDGATVRAIVDNGVEYNSIDAWKAAQ